MIQFSANIQACLNSDNIEAFYLLRITYSNGTPIYSSTSHFHDITLSNGYVYTADSLIEAVDPPNLSSSVDKEQYKIVLADPSLSEMSILESNIIGKLLETRVGFINKATGLPFLSTSDTLVVYKGRIESANYIIDTKEIGECKLQISGSSPIVNLDQKNGIYLSKDSIRRRDGTDTCCDQIYEGSGALVLKWGKV